MLIKFSYNPEITNMGIHLLNSFLQSLYNNGSKIINLNFLCSSYVCKLSFIDKKSKLALSTQFLTSQICVQNQP